MSAADMRLQVVDDFSRAIGDVFALDEVLRTAVNAAVPGLADLAVIVYGEGENRVEVAHADPRRADGVRHAVEDSLEPLRRLARQRSRTGRLFQWIPTLTPGAVRRAVRHDPQLAALLHSLEAGSLIVVALPGRDRPLGALALVRTSHPEPYSASDLVVARVIGRRIGAAVESARLHASMQATVRHHGRMEEALRLWTRVFELAGWGAAVVSHQDRRVEAVNPAFARMHGFRAPDDLAGRSFTDLLPDDRLDEPWSWEALSAGHGTSYESVHRRIDGRTLPVLVSVTPTDEHGHPASYVVTVQDLTELKRAEERLRRAQRMEAVGRLAGGVAHEVNNMMTIILGFSDLLAQADELPEHLVRDVDEIRKAATRAGRITQQLLAFSRQQVLQPADLRVNTVVEELVPVLRLLLPANVRVETRLSPMDAIVRADRGQLEQVLINLAFNARDAMPNGGAIRVVSEARYLNEETGQRLIGVPFQPGQYALLSVIDSGHGMDEGTLEQLFEPFFTTKPAGRGTGLGLATVYGIVKQSGGYVWAESTPGVGTTFTVGLPLTEAFRHEAPEREDVERTEPEPAGTVLIVEDEDGVRQLARRLLEGRGYEVLEARNGEEALGAMGLQGEQVDVVLTDVVVPDIGTEELARRVRQIREDVRILYMSGYPLEEVLERNLIAPDQPFLQKPFTGDELTEGVGQVLRGDRPVVGG